MLLVAGMVLFSCQSESLTNETAQPYSELAKRLLQSEGSDNANALEGRNNGTVLDFLLADADYTVLVAAASKIAGLPEVLSRPRLNVTLFAPTNEAFVQFLADNNIPSLDDVPLEVLEAVLANHFLVGGKTADQLGAYESTASMVSFDEARPAQLSLYVNKDNGVTLNGNVAVIGANNLIGRSVVHKVSSVIALPNVVTFAVSNPLFSSLVEALTRPDLSIDFVSVLSGAGPFTVLAPTNQAFDNLLVALGLNTIAEIPADVLETVLLYHVAGGNLRANKLSKGRTVATLAEPNTYKTQVRMVIYLL
ncbi:MAG: fasciclin domain-containing protein [Saprospiraceae bacterium]|nr:fasciclin domain-containing protein [Saprospiraceae bacterium]